MKQSINLIAAACLLLLSSCNHYFYSPNSPNVPIFREQGETRATVGTMSADYITGQEFQLAHSPIKGVAIMANHLTVEANQDNGRGNFTEGGIGYYIPFDHGFTVQAFGLYGEGYAFNRYDSVATIRNSIKKASLALSFGYRTKWLETGASFNPCYISTPITKISPGLGNVEVDELIRTPHSFLLEGGMFIRGGYKNLKAQLQFTVSSNYTNSSFPQQEGIGSLSLTYLFNFYKGKAGKLWEANEKGK